MNTTLNEHYRRLLDLDSAWKVDQVDLELERNRVVIDVKHVGGPVVCPKCSGDCSIADHAPQREWRHLDTMQFETILRASVPRSRCKSCGVKTTAVPWAGKHSRFTLMFEAFGIRVIDACDNVSDAAALLRLSWKSVHQIMARGVERGLERRDLSEVKRVGLDEKSFRRSQSYITAMSDLDESRVIEVVKERTTEATKELLCTLPDEVRGQIEAVALDMWPAFIRAVDEQLPGVAKVFDRFHVSKHLNDAVDKVRRQEHKSLASNGDNQLAGSKYCWLKSPERHNEKQREQFESLRKANLKTARAWAIKESFNDFWNSRNAGFGEGAFKRWYSWAIRSRLEPIKQQARMLKKHYYGLITWFEHRITNSVSEGFNSRIQSLKSAARGFRNFENYRIRILFFCGKLDMMPETSH